MLYIVSQDGMRITDLRAVTVVTPENDRYEEDVYKVYVNGAEFARYTQEYWAKRIIPDIKSAIQRADREHDYYQLPKEVIV